MVSYYYEGGKSPIFQRFIDFRKIKSKTLKASGINGYSGFCDFKSILREGFENIYLMKDFFFVFGLSQE